MNHLSFSAAIIQLIAIAAIVEWTVRLVVSMERGHSYKNRRLPAPDRSARVSYVRADEPPTRHP